jgi:hypothetical protein
MLLLLLVVEESARAALVTPVRPGTVHQEAVPRLSVHFFGCFFVLEVKTHYFF